MDKTVTFLHHTEYVLGFQVHRSPAGSSYVASLKGEVDCKNWRTLSLANPINKSVSIDRSSLYIKFIKNGLVNYACRPRNLFQTSNTSDITVIYHFK